MNVCWLRRSIEKLPGHTKSSWLNGVGVFYHRGAAPQLSQVGESLIRLVDTSRDVFLINCEVDRSQPSLRRQPCRWGFSESTSPISPHWRDCFPVCHIAIKALRLIHASIAPGSCTNAAYQIKASSIHILLKKSILPVSLLDIYI